MALMKFREPNQAHWQGVRPAHNGTQVFVHNTVANDSIDIYTVPAGKMFYLCTAVLNYIAVDAGVAIIAVRNDVPAIVSYIVYESKLAGSEGNSKVVSFWLPLELLSGWSVQLISSAVGLNIRGMVFGWVE